MTADRDPAVLARRLDGVYVLAVDDDDDSRTVLSMLLSIHGASVLAASSAAEALAALSRVRPDVIVSDISMPDEDGLSLIRKVRALDPGGGGAVPAVALTGLARPEHRAAALEAGFQEHLRKPLVIEELLVAIEKLTGRRE